LAEQAAMEARGASDGERKTITALFADLKGSTALIEGLDPEDARAIIDPALQIMMDAVHRYDGYVAQALGDGIFALFGAPIAHEDHPQRALYAALRMQEEMRGYSDRLRLGGGAPLQMRVGINTGEVVVRSIRKDDLHTDYVPVGHSTNLAARMEQLAAPGSIVVTAYTHKLTDGYFEFKDLGKTQIKGAEEPLNVYEVLGAGPLRTRFQVTARRGLTRFVGRHSELDQLRRALAQAKAGQGGMDDLKPLVDLRSLAMQGALRPDDLSLAGMGRALAAWHIMCKCCGRCGGHTIMRDAGWRRQCWACGQEFYPRSDPAVIVLITDGTRCLLGHHKRYAHKFYSTLAGFVEPGEDFEDCVRREMREETGISVGEVTYMASQPWPFPHLMMVGCWAQALTSELTLEEEELHDARWFTRDEVLQMMEDKHPQGFTVPGPHSIAHALIKSFVDSR